MQATTESIHVALGVGYAVHARQVTVGIAAAAVLPISPLRVAPGLVPHVRYTS